MEPRESTETFVDLRDRVIDWHHTLATGGSVPFDDDEALNSVRLGIVRWMNGLGADRTDDRGEWAMAVVLSVLDSPPSGQEQRDD